jgi:hypothetical protein
MPSLSSGATAEYHRSRQSHDSSVRSLGGAHPFGSAPARRLRTAVRPGEPTRRSEHRNSTSAPTGTTYRSRPNAPWTEAEVMAGPQGSEPDRPSEPPRPRPGCSLPDPLRTRRRQAIVSVRGGPRWRARHEPHAGTTEFRPKRSQRASDPTFRRKPCRREIVPVGFDSERGEMHAYAAPVTR